jgi:hypothetical protein
MMPINSFLRGVRLASNLPARSLRRLEEHNVMSARRRDACRFQPAGSAADHDHLALRAPGVRDDVRHRRLTSCGGIVHAHRVVAFVYTVEAIGGADAGTDLVLAPRHELAPDMGVGDVRASHPHHIELACRDRVPRRRHFLDTRSVKHREPRRVAHLSGKIEMRRCCHAMDRDHPPQGGIGIHVTTNDIEEVNRTRSDDATSNLDALRAGQSDIPSLIGHHADADNESGTSRGTHRIEHAMGEAQAVVQAAAVLVRAVIGRR